MNPNVTTPKKSSSLLYIFLFAILILIGYFAYSFVMNQDDKKDDGQNTQQEDDNQNDDSQNEGENENPDSNGDEGTSGDEVSNGSDGDEVDLSEFKTSPQSVGSDSGTDGFEHTIQSFKQIAKDGFHRFEFEVVRNNKNATSPYVTASYIPSLGSIRVDFKGVTEDLSGIGYQKSMMINKEGIVKVYHNVSADQTEELYDVGVVKETPFYLSSWASDLGFWIITLDVKYPGVSENTDEIDLGSEDFSKETQSIVGGTRSDGAKVSSYSYSASGGVLRIVFEVKGSSDKPIPSVNAGYDGDGLLVMRFTDVVSDAIAKMPAALTMTGGVTMTWEMESANTSMYTFEGASKEFKLYGGTNPNQVIIEIKL